MNLLRFLKYNFLCFQAKTQVENWVFESQQNDALFAIHTKN